MGRWRYRAGLKTRSVAIQQAASVELVAGGAVLRQTWPGQDGIRLVSAALARKVREPRLQ